MRIERGSHRHQVLAHGLDEASVRDDGAAHDIAMARRVLGQAVQEHVHVEAAMVVKTRERVVHDGEAPRAPRMRGQMRDVGDLGDRIGRAFEDDQTRRGPFEHALDAREILDRQQRVRDSVAREQLLHDIAGGTVGFDERENVIALPAQRQQRRRERRHPRPDEQAILAPLHPREREFELPQRRIGTARIIETRPLAAEETHRFARVVEGELDRLIDRRHQRPVVGGHEDLGRMVHEGVVGHARHHNRGGRALKAAANGYNRAP